jgi:hypothetical protein
MTRFFAFSVITLVILVSAHRVTAKQGYTYNPSPFAGTWSTKKDCGAFLWEFSNDRVRIFQMLTSEQQSRAKFLLNDKVFHLLRRNSAEAPHLYDTVSRFEVIEPNLLRFKDVTHFRGSEIVKRQKSAGLLYKCRKGFLGFGWRRDLR